MERAAPQRTVHCEDALVWLKETAPLVGASMITSLPDVSGLQGLSLGEWKEWFIGAARLCIDTVPDDGVTIFYQTDIKVEGTWVDKAFLCHKAAEQAGAELLWHKIFCRKAPGVAAFGRPGYAHMVCYSRGVRDRIDQSYADVFESPGAMTWSQATGATACDFACRYVRSHTTSETIVDPFCGVGTVLAAANNHGFDAIGVEIALRRARKARNLRLPTAEKLQTLKDALGESADDGHDQ